MVRYGRGFPLPRQTFMVNPVSETKIVQVILAPASDPSSGIHFYSLQAGDLTILTSEEIVVDILGQGTGLDTGNLGTGSIDGGTEISTDISGQAVAQVYAGDIDVTGDAYEFGGWRNPAGKIPRRKWKKNKPFRDKYLEEGVEFSQTIVNEKDYGPWFYIVDESPTLLRSEEEISSDYSIEGRP